MTRPPARQAQTGSGCAGHPHRCLRALEHRRARRIFCRTAAERIVFVSPYEDDFSTDRPTDVDYQGDTLQCSDFNQGTVMLLASGQTVISQRSVQRLSLAFFGSGAGLVRSGHLRAKSFLRDVQFDPLRQHPRQSAVLSVSAQDHRPLRNWADVGGEQLSNFSGMAGPAMTADPGLGGWTSRNHES